MKSRSTYFLALVALTLPAVAFAQFAPKNDWSKYDNVNKRDSNITKDQFNQISNDMINTFAPFATLHGGNLTVNADWNDATVNSSADQEGNSWVVNTYGGLARRSEITADGFKAVICHELGHHLGGFAFYGDTDWAAAEGEADRFATAVCLPFIWVSEKDTNATFRKTITANMQKACDAKYSDTDRQNLCYRIATAGQGLANLLAALGGDGVPNVDKPDPSTVTTTNVDHPASQCRLDTYFNGALCDATFDLHVIPGRNNAGGQTSKAAQDEAAKYSCLGTGAFQTGERPRCWFAPLTQ
jgi:hypothetical protein